MARHFNLFPLLTHWVLALLGFYSLHGGLASELPVVGSGSSAADWAEARQDWAFQVPKTQPLPEVRNISWPRQRIDYFVLAKLESLGLPTSPEADPRLLIRRLSLDLTGLPPSPEEVESFCSGPTEDAYVQLVDRMLGSPRFGERLTSLWLNVARYAEDQAHMVDNDPSPFYPNAHHYRAWVIDAFNRDLPYDQFIRLQLAADLIAPEGKGDLPALGFIGLGPKYYDRERLDVMADEWEDRVDVVSRSFLGLSVACARCHDHKYDPITMEDYYAMAGVFSSTRLVNKTVEGDVFEFPKKTKDRRKTKLPDEYLHIVEDADPKDLQLFLRGDVESPRDVIPRRFLRILCPDDPKPFQRGSGRAELAEAIASPNNPLTARVMVNRLWGFTFGRALIATPSNFGKLAEPPTHPELLDDCASALMREDWSVKRLIRQFVLSSTYRQGSETRSDRLKRDPANRWLSRMNRRRLSAEQWRDSILAVSGTLDLDRHGPSKELDDPENFRRTVYGRVSRLLLDEMLMLFDYPDPNMHADRRAITTTATQKLYQLNGPFLLRQADALALRLTAEKDNASRIERAYALLYGRAPTEEETRLGVAFLDGAAPGSGQRWSRYTHALLNSTELLYVD